MPVTVILTTSGQTTGQRASIPKEKYLLTSDLHGSSISPWQRMLKALSLTKAAGVPSKDLRASIGVEHGSAQLQEQTMPTQLPISSERSPAILRS